MNLLSRNFLPVVVLSTACYGAFFYSLGDYPLWDPDEGRSGAIVKEIARSGNWLTLTHRGEPYHDKPALYFWLAALCSKIVGMNELAVRLPSAIAAAVTVSLVFLWGGGSGGARKGLWAGLILASSSEFVALGRFGKMDMVFTLFFTAALLHFFYWHHRTQDRGWIWPFFFFLALAALAKGPAGILLPVLIVGVFLALKRRCDALRHMGWLRGFAIVALVAGSWYVPAALRDPAYVKSFLWDHNILRFLTITEAIDHGGPVYYFIPILLGGFLPWSFYLPAVVGRIWERRSEDKSGEQLFLTVWVLTVFVFFSLSHNKLGTYILPLFPPLALLTAGAVAELVSGNPGAEKRSRWIVYGSLAWLALLFLAFPASEWLMQQRFPRYSSGHLPLAVAGLFLAAGGMVRYLGRVRWTPGIVCASFLWLALWFYGDKVNEISRHKSSRGFARIIDRAATDGERIIFIRSESFPFYLSKPAKELPHPKAVSVELRDPLPTIALVKEKHIRELQARSAETLYVWEAIPSGLALVANYPHPSAHDLGNPPNP